MADGALPPLQLGFELDLTTPVAQAKRGRQAIEQEMKGVEGAAARAETGFRRMGSGAEDAARNASRGMRGLIGGIGAAQAAAAGAERSFASMGSSLLMSFVAGGPVALGLAAAGAAIGYMVGKSNEAAEAAKKARQEFTDFLDSVKRKADDAQQALGEMRGKLVGAQFGSVGIGLSPERLKLLGEARSLTEEIAFRESMVSGAFNGDRSKLIQEVLEQNARAIAAGEMSTEDVLAIAEKRRLYIEQEKEIIVERKRELAAKQATLDAEKRILDAQQKVLDDKRAADREAYNLKVRQAQSAGAGRFVVDPSARGASGGGGGFFGWEDEVRAQHEAILLGQRFIETQTREAQLAAATTDEERERLRLRFEIEDLVESGKMLAEDEAEALAAGTRALEARAAARRRADEERAAKESIEKAQREAEAREKVTLEARKDLEVRRASAGVAQDLVRVEQRIAELRATSSLNESELAELRSSMIAEVLPKAEIAVDQWRSEFGPPLTHAFADAIYDGFATGFRNADDLARSFFESIGRAAAASLANMAVQGLFGLFGGGMTSSGAGGFVSTLVGAFSGGGILPSAGTGGNLSELIGVGANGPAGGC